MRVDMYRLMMIAMLFVMSSTIFAMPFGTVINLGGTKMIVVSQEGEEIRLKPFVVEKVAKNPAIPKPEWESKTTITEGVKNVQECLNPLGCPQNATTGECIEGCSEQQVHVKVEERIIDKSRPLIHKDYSSLMFVDDHEGTWEKMYPQYYGTTKWLCFLSEITYGSASFRINLSKTIMTDPALFSLCEKTFPRGNRPWRIIYTNHIANN